MGAIGLCPPPIGSNVFLLITNFFFYLLLTNNNYCLILINFYSLAPPLSKCIQSLIVIRPPNRGECSDGLTSSTHRPTETIRPSSGYYYVIPRDGPKACSSTQHNIESIDKWWVSTKTVSYNMILTFWARNRKTRETTIFFFYNVYSFEIREKQP